MSCVVRLSALFVVMCSAEQCAQCGVEQRAVSAAVLCSEQCAQCGVEQRAVSATVQCSCTLLRSAAVRYFKVLHLVIQTFVHHTHTHTQNEIHLESFYVFYYHIFTATCFGLSEPSRSRAKYNSKHTSQV
jgi:hypothetical protein